MSPGLDQRISHVHNISSVGGHAPLGAERGVVALSLVLKARVLKDTQESDDSGHKKDGPAWVKVPFPSDLVGQQIPALPAPDKRVRARKPRPQGRECVRVVADGTRVSATGSGHFGEPASRSGIALGARGLAALLCSAGLAGIVVSPALAVDIRPSIFTGVDYDSNLTRSANEDEVLSRYGTTQMSDVVTSAGVGLTADIKGGRSNLSASGNVSHRFYSEFSDFDATNADATANFGYQLSSNCSAGTKGNYSLRLASFEDVQTNTNGRNLQTRWGAGINGQCRLFDRISVTANTDYSELGNESDVRQGNDRETIAYGGSVAYNTPRGDSFGLRGTYRDNHFPNPVTDPSTPSQPSNRDFSISGLNAFADLGLLATLRLNLSGGVSHTTREAAGATNSTRSNGDVRLTWSPTSRTTLSAYLRRSISEVDDVSGGTRLSSQVGASASTALTNRISVSANVSYSNDEFRNALGDPTTDLVTSASGDRSEDRLNGSLGFNYALTQLMGLSGGLRYSKRQSDYALNEYESFGAFLTLSLSFGAF